MACEGRDSLALRVFNLAGYMLGRHVKALIPKADKVRRMEINVLVCVCVTVCVCV